MTEKRYIRFFFILVTIVFLLLFLQLLNLQVILGKETKFLAEQNRIQKKIIKAPRGLILDRHGEILARNDPFYFLKGLAISRDEALTLQADNKIQDLEIFLKRVYPNGALFSHVLGYLGEVSDTELSKGKLELKGYFLGSLIGRSGIEMQYEDLLRGRNGIQLVEVDTNGKVIRRMGEVLPTAGKNLTLSIDKKLQEVAAKDMEEKKGAVIATDPKNGEVLVFYSSPSFDPNLFLDKGNSGQLAKIINDQQSQPLFNRVSSGRYAPGSTFKIVTSIAGLEEKKITASTLINDPGIIYVNDFKYANWYFTAYGRTEGEINLQKAISRSTDTFFYKLGEMVGVDDLTSWAKKFGVGKVSGIDLPDEVASFIGDPAWKLSTRGEKWFLGNTYHLAIGQGDIALTPLEVNLLGSAVASQGKICVPRMLRIGAENTPYQEDCHDLGVKKEYWETVKRGMIGACSAGGTAYPFFDFKPEGLPADFRVACKTGTAETGDGKTTHAWFTAFVPSDNPEIVLTVLVEKGGEGSSVAAPIAKEILKEYFKE